MSIYATSASATNYIQYNLNKSTNNYNKAMDQLSSGSKITDHSDDPMGVARVAKLDVQLSANAVNTANVSQGQDFLNLAEGNQDLVISNLQRIRDLTMQASSGSYTPEDKDAMLSEIKARLTEIDTIASKTKFNDINIMDGTANHLTIQMGANSSSRLDVGSALINVSSTALGVNLGAGVTGATWTEDDAHNYLTSIDNAIGTLAVSTSKLGGFMNRLDDAASTLTSTKDSMMSNRSLISDSDVASTSADIVKYQILQQASVSILAQANQVPSWALNLLK